MISCDSGEAYQGKVIGPSFKLLYFHPLGLSISVTPTSFVCGCAYVVVGCLLDSSMGYLNCDPEYQSAVQFVTAVVVVFKDA